MSVATSSYNSHIENCCFNCEVFFSFTKKRKLWSMLLFHNFALHFEWKRKSIYTRSSGLIIAKKAIKTQFTFHLKYYNDYLTFLNLFQVLHQLLNRQYRNLYHYLSSKQLLHPMTVSFLSPFWIFMIQNVEFRLLRDLRRHINPNMKRHYVSNTSVNFHAI